MNTLNTHTLEKRYLTIIILLTLSIFSFQEIIFAKSLYVISNINASPTPIQAYDIQPASPYLVYQATHNVPYHGGGGVGITVDTNSKYLFVTYEDDNIIELIDATTMTSAGTTIAPGASNLAGIVVDQGKKLVYTVDRETNNLYIYIWNATLKTLTLDHIEPLANITSAHGIALDEINGLLFVADRQSKIVRYFRTSNWTEAGNFTITQIPTGIAVDVAKRFVYTGNPLATYGGVSYGGMYLLSKYDLNTGIETTIDIRTVTGIYPDNVVGLTVDQSTNLLYITTGDQAYGGSDRLMVFDSDLNLLSQTADIGDPTGLCIPQKEVSYNPLNLTKEDLDGNGIVAPNGTITYRISVDNLLNEDVHNVTLIDSLPADLNFVSANEDGSYNNATHKVTWNRVILFAGDGAKYVELVAKVDAGTPHGTLITNYVTIDSDDTPPTTTSVDVIVSDINTFKLAAPIMGSTRAFLQWGAFGAYDKYHYIIHVEGQGLLAPSRVIKYDADGEEIHIPKFIVENLRNWWELNYKFKFYVEAVDSLGRSWLSGPVYGTTKERDNIPIPNPIILVPGVGSTLTKDEFFTDVRNAFEEFGWIDSVPATVEYNANEYINEKSPKQIHWFNSQEPLDFSKVKVFTFVPYRPTETGAHEIGIAQKGIELGYFLKYLEGKGKNNFQLVGHSLGGLTCRAYIQRVKEPNLYSNNVVRLVTTGTPNNGVLKDHRSYSAVGVKDILLDSQNGYFKADDSDRLAEFIQKGWERPRVVKYMTDLIELLSFSGWDFDANTLKYDVLYDSNSFLHDLNIRSSDETYGDLPNLQYVSLIGQVSSFGQTQPTDTYWKNFVLYHFYNSDIWNPGGNNAFMKLGTRTSNPCDEGDGIVSADSQNLATVVPNFTFQPSVKTINRPFNHREEEGDYIGMLMGLGYPVLSFKSASPVDLLVTAPSGEYITKGDSAMFLTSYTEIYEEGHDTPSDLIEIPFPEDGEYSVKVIPDPNADPNDTYSLIMFRNETTIVLADNVKISDIPHEPYKIAAWSAIQINKCTVTAGKGKNKNKDNIVLSGSTDVNSFDFSKASDVYINIGGVDSEIILASSFIVKKGKYTYTHKIIKGAAGTITSFVIDTNKHTFSLKAQKVNLTGLHCLFNVEFKIGDYWGACTVDENIVNGKKFIPVQLMSGIKDYLQVQSVKVKKGTLTDTLTVKGGIALENPSSPISDVNLCKVDLVLTLGKQTLTIPAGSFKTSGKSGLKFVCKNAAVSGGIANGTFDYGKCTFVISIKNTKINSATGKVGLTLTIGSFNEQVNFDFDAGQTIY